MDPKRNLLRRRPAAFIGAGFAAVVLLGTALPWARVWGRSADGVEFDRGLMTAVIALAGIALCIVRALNGDRGTIYAVVGLTLVGLMIWLQVWFLVDIQNAIDDHPHVGHYGSPARGLWISMFGTAGFAATMLLELARGVRPQRLLHRPHAAGA